MPSARPSLAVDLARQAAAAALAEVQEPAPVSAMGARWQPATLPDDFNLTPALQQALQRVAGHLGQWLQHEGLEVAATPQTLSQKHDSKLGLTPPSSTLEVREAGNGRLVRGYSTAAVLGLFASQQQRNGVVVDGKV